ncbi:GNAT family N-acetyltransferase [uncultured Winogradskyella sp.]|uniref:GNAT family N-acetyltransferase n=1 Tax=uncultured Winogradskyella sp. TaxID=395353 RepID=UPI00261B8B88|nr:GNAT family N-acetyltransferase [uncultured Winogradskyella sp.]
MVVKHLGNTDFDIIMECFLSAFENYFVKMPTNHDFYRERWKAAGVRYDMSYGMFDSDRLVGFIINAIDERRGYLTAYNSGTGVIPEYRGKRIVKSIYDYAIPELIKSGVTKCQLEVITENVKAIKSYQGIGFKICKHFKCYKGILSAETYNNYTLKQVLHQDINWNAFPNQNLYSWDNQKESLIKGNYEYYEVHVKDKLQSYFIMNSKSGYIAQFEVLEDSVFQWQNLFFAIHSINSEIRINNVDDKLVSKVEALELAGLQNSVNQYEMVLKL